MIFYISFPYLSCLWPFIIHLIYLSISIRTPPTIWCVTNGKTKYPYFSLGSWISFWGSYLLHGSYPRQTHTSLPCLGRYISLGSLTAGKYGRRLIKEQPLTVAPTDLIKDPTPHYLLDQHSKRVPRRLSTSTVMSSYTWSLKGKNKHIGTFYIISPWR